MISYFHDRCDNFKQYPITSKFIAATKFDFNISIKQERANDSAVSKIYLR